MEHGILPKTHYPVINENERAIYLHNPKTSYVMQKKSFLINFHVNKFHHSKRQNLRS